MILTHCIRRSIRLILSASVAISPAWSETAPSAADFPTPVQRFASAPALSPDGTTVVFSWRRDLWAAPVAGGRAERLTSHPAMDSHPMFSADGETLYFSSYRDGARQLYAMPSNGGAAERLSHHSEGLIPEALMPDGRHALIRARRDHGGANPDRLFLLPLSPSPRGERLFLDFPARAAAPNADGLRVLFCRYGENVLRKGYRGSRASQVWMYHAESGEFSQLTSGESGSDRPIWQPGANAYYYQSDRSSTWNVWRHDLDQDEHTQLTFFTEDGVYDPALSADGSMMVFNVGAELWKWSPTASSPPEPLRIEITAAEPALADELRRIRGTTDADFSRSGLEIVFAADGVLFTMDTVLRRPNPITEGSAIHSTPRFTRDGDAILAIRDDGLQRRLVRLSRINPEDYWWQATVRESVFPTSEGRLVDSFGLSSDGRKVAWVERPGRLMVADADGSNPNLVFEHWENFPLEWSPDGKWLALVLRDADFNHDIHIVSADGSRPPVNISRHPGYEFSPKWSPDGRKIAFLGKRSPSGTRIHMAHLSMEDHLRTLADLRRDEAEQRMADDPWYQRTEEPEPERDPTPPEPGNNSTEENPADPPGTANNTNAPQPQKEPGALAKEREKPTDATEEEETDGPDFDAIHERIISLDSGTGAPAHLIWSPDSKHLWFQTTNTADKAIYRVEARAGASRSRLAPHRGIPIRADSGGNSYWLVDNAPARLRGEALATYPIVTEWLRDRPDHLALGFNLIWRTMRDEFYDPGLNNLDWDGIREKYLPLARDAANSREYSQTMSLMFGELNASHLHFSANAWPPVYSDPGAVFRTTRHTGLRFQTDDEGRILVESVLPESPAHAARPAILPGDILVEVDGRKPARHACLARLFNGRAEHDVSLSLLRPGQETPTRHRLRSIPFSEARALARKQEIARARRHVESKSDGRLGYIHIPRMFAANFDEFQREIFAAGHGRDALVIDIRDNSGGNISDHLLTILTQPHHALTLPRNGHPGYPGYRTVYTSWNKPIVVLCNEQSFSNAEIFAHAIKTIGRGELVGRPTAGSVISTSSRPLLDLGKLSVPFRGWFHPETGLDMELGPAVPDHIVENPPGEWIAGRDQQLDTAIAVMLAGLEATPPPTPPTPVFRRESGAP